MKNKSNIIFICIFVNVILGTLVHIFNIPLLFLDTIGTIFISIALGPVFGAMVGGLSNIILGLISNPTALSYFLSNIALGFIVGYYSKKRCFNYKEALIVGLILSIICPLISTPISLYLFGNLNLGDNSLLSSVLTLSNKIIFSGSFIPRFISNLFDKLISCLVVSYILSKTLNNNLDLNKLI